MTIRANFCLENGATTEYSHAELVAAIQQGARYALGDPKPQVVGMSVGLNP